MTSRTARSPRRRTTVAFAVVLAVLIAFVVRLVDIQVVNAQSLLDDSRGVGNIAGSATIYGARGTITDETGAVLAGNASLYDAALDPKNIFARDAEDLPEGQGVEETWKAEAAAISAVTGQDAADVEALAADAFAADPATRWVQLKKGLTTDQYLELRDLNFGAFLSLTSHPVRTYPDGAVGGNLLGFVDPDGVPLAGVELAEQDCLTAVNGRRDYERGRDGVIIPGTMQETPAQDGGTLQLTINRDLQWFMQQLVAEEVQNQNARSGMIMVLEVGTGKIRAAAEYPSMDPNVYSETATEDMGSRIFTTSFEPGSTYKPVTAATVIEEGKATPTRTTVSAAGRETLNGITINDVFTHEAYNYTLTGALVDSSNVALSKFGDLVSEDTRKDYLERFGVGKGTEIDFPGQSKGLIHDTPWDAATHWTTTFGQAYTVTLPQLASVYETFGNGGVRTPLRIVENCTMPDGTVVEPDLPEPERVISEQTADDVLTMIENVNQQVTNTKVLAIPGYRMGTKSGTAQKPGANGAYKSGVYFTTLAGVGPIDDPKYVVIYTLDEPLKNRMSSANASGWQKAMTQVLKTYRVLPSSGSPEILPKYQ